MPRVFVRELARHHRHSGSSRSVSTAADGIQKGRRKRAGFALAAVSIVGSGTYYYAMTRVPPLQPSPLPPAQAAVPPPAAPTLAIQPPSPVEVSARVELLQRMDSLQSELEALRMQKRDKLIDMKKQALKEDIQTIRSGLAALEKQAS